MYHLAFLLELFEKKLSSSSKNGTSVTVPATSKDFRTLLKLSEDVPMTFQHSRSYLK